VFKKLYTNGEQSTKVKFSDQRFAATANKWQFYCAQYSKVRSNWYHDKEFKMKPVIKLAQSLSLVY